MRIGIDISQIVYQTGVSRYTSELVKHLLKIDPNNHYFFYAGSLRQRQILRSFLTEIRTPKTSAAISWLSPHLADFFWNRLNLLPPDTGSNLDVFHASNWALPKTKAKLITTIHDLTFLKYPQTHTSYSVAVHTRHLTRAQKYADRIIAVSGSTKKDLVDYGIPEGKISVIYEAPNRIFKPLKDLKQLRAIKAKYHLKTRYLLSVGTREPRKNLKRLIKAYLNLNLTDTPLVIVGKFGWGDKTKTIPNVKLLGFVPDEDLVGLYSSAQAFVYPSLYEGFGFPVIEAMACGCPVVTSNCSSLPEISGQAALYVNPLSVTDISHALKLANELEAEKRQSLIQTGFAQARQFSWEKTAKETLKLYQEVVKC